MIDEIDHFMKDANKKYGLIIGAPQQSSSPSTNLQREIPYSKLVTLNYNLKQEIMTMNRLLSHREDSIKSAIICEDIVETRNTKMMT